MYFFGILFIALGGWLIDSGVENRHPIATLEALVQAGPQHWNDITKRTDLKLGNVPAVKLPGPSQLVGDAAKGAVSTAKDAASTVGGVVTGPAAPLFGVVGMGGALVKQLFK